MVSPAPAQSVLATRKPIVLLRLSGWFLLRLAERRLSGLLFQEPPRRTREDGAVQAPGRNECEARRRKRYVLPANRVDRVGARARAVSVKSPQKISARLRRGLFRSVPGHLSVFKT
jgi:hypothetical protein